MKTKIPPILLILCLTTACSDAATKKADLAGSWYPGSKPKLEKMLDGFLDAAEPKDLAGKPIGFILPHAGLVYSGPVAACGYRLLKDSPTPIKTAVIVGFNHRYRHPGTAVCAFDSYTTPLGEIAIDKDLSKKLTRQHKNIYFLNEAFEDENSSEMQVPFIQRVLNDSKLVLIHMGEQTRENIEILADALYTVLKDRDDFILIASTDMSHYLPADRAEDVDWFTSSHIAAFDPYRLFEESAKRGHQLMCGIGPVVATMLAAKRLGADSVEILKRAHSGDVTGDRSRVVGYLAAAIVKSQVTSHKSQVNEGEDMGLTREDKKKLLQIARETLEAHLSNKSLPEFEINSPVLMENRGAFVTLHKHGQLRGCIGHMVGSKPLYLTVQAMAIEAATQDPRFPKVTYEELKDIDIEISALSPLEKVDSADQIELGKHGVIVKKGFRQGVYLPQVATETGWSKEEFLSSLCSHKAGLEPYAWKDKDTDLIVFTAQVFSEKEMER